MRVQLLGPVQVTVDGEPVDLGGPRSRALLARLALAGGRAVGVGTLVADLWGQDDAAGPADAANALQSIVSRTRRRLPSGAVDLAPTGYRLVGATVDVEDFERDLRDGRSAAALRRWNGTPLADLPDDLPFVAPARSRLVALRDGAVEADVMRRAERSPDEVLLLELAALIDAHPHREPLRLARLTALSALGRAAEALDEYEELRRTLADELGVDPSPALQQWHLRALRGETAPDPAPPAAAEPPTAPAPGPPSGLPSALTELIGREESLDDVARALTRARLVTVVGPGGTGKTRLAVEVARRHLEDTSQQVWLAELATVVDPDDVAGALLTTFGLTEPTSSERRRLDTRDDRTRLRDQADRLRGLLVLDNCEHLIDAAADIAELLLSRAPGLAIVATSREPLRLIGETVYQLASLPVPGEGAPAAVAARSAAVQLFAARATAADPGFALDDTTVGPVTEICRRLDGQPLALELAAARLRTMDVAVVAERLADRFGLLVGNRGAVPRHRTLRAVVDWSWDLLDDTERDLVERLAVFPAPFTVAAASYLLGDDAGDVLDRLADKSLLVPLRASTPQASTPGASTPRGPTRGRAGAVARRFRMLETIREFGLQRLHESGRLDTARSTHLDWVLAFTEANEPGLRGPDQIEALSQVDTESGNVAAAIRYAIDIADRPRAIRLVRAMVLAWIIHDRNFESLTTAAEVTALPGRGDPGPEIVCTALTLMSNLDDPDHMHAVADQILRLWDEGTDDPIAVAAVATIDWFGLAGDRTLPDYSGTWTELVVNLLQINLLENDGRMAETEALIDRTITLCEERGERWALSMVLGERAELSAWRGELDAASDAWTRSADLLDELGSHGAAEFVRLRVTMLLAEAEPERIADARRSLENYRTDEPIQQQVTDLALARFDHLAGDHMAALRRLDGLFDGTHGAARMPQFTATSHSLAAHAAWALGDSAGAARHVLAALEHSSSTGDRPLQAEATATVARLADDATAAVLLGAADALRGLPDLSDHALMAFIESLRERLGDSFDAGYAEGHRLDRDAAVALARRVADRVAQD